MSLLNKRNIQFVNILTNAGLVRFAPRSNTSGILIGQPVKDDIDVGLALRNDTEVQVDVFSGTSVLNPGQSTGKVEIIHKIFSPLAANEVGTIRCIGLNVSSS